MKDNEVTTEAVNKRAEDKTQIHDDSISEIRRSRLEDKTSKVLKIEISEDTGSDSYIIPLDAVESQN